MVYICKHIHSNIYAHTHTLTGIEAVLCCGLPVPRMAQRAPSCWSTVRTESVAVCCILLRCVAVCCILLRCVVVCCILLQCVAFCCGVLQCVVVCCSALQCVAVSDQQMVKWILGVGGTYAVCCSVLQCVTVRCGDLHCIVVWCMSVAQMDEQTPSY